MATILAVDSKNGLKDLRGDTWAQKFWTRKMEMYIDYIDFIGSSVSKPGVNAALQ